MSIEITKEIQNALQRLIDDYGSILEIERKTHISNATIGKYRTGEIKRINPRTWAVLEPHLRPYLPGDVVNAGVIGSGRIYGPVIGKAGSVVQRHAGASPEELAANRSATLDEVLDAVMESDIDDAAKIRFYGILKQLKKGE